MVNFTFNTTASIHHEIGGSKKLGELVSGMSSVLHGSTVMFVTDPGIMKLNLANPALDSLSRAGFSIVIFDQVEADPKEQTILDAVNLAQQQGVLAIVGFGGGSSMDVAKLISLLVGSQQDISDIYGVNQASGSRLPLVLVPTTAGTGSEVTAISIVTTGNEEKKGVVSPILLPDIALLDAELTVGLPPSITAATGIDAMVHAIEAFTSNSPNNNLLSKMQAKQALSLLSANIEEAVFNGQNIEARSNMLLGSMLAGQSFANSPVAAVHALAYPIGSLFHVPHGLSNALVLCQVMSFNAPVCHQEYASLAPFIFPDMAFLRSSESITKELVERLFTLIQKLNLETQLSQVGIRAHDIDRLAEDAMKQTRLLVNNPRKMTLDEIKGIYSNVL